MLLAIRAVILVTSSFVAVANVATDFAVSNDRCTTIVVGGKVGTLGPMNTHTADCANCDFRINKVPAKDWPANSLRPLYLYKLDYPATITSTRGETWQPDNLEGADEQIAAWGQESVVTGYVPQVTHTFALYEAGYGIMNEHQVAIGESSCPAKLFALPVTMGGKARIEVREMSQIALERSKTAREAIQIMGDLATTYGFYTIENSSIDASKGDGGEALTIVDKTEAWVFHVLADDTGTSAVWVAQQVDPDHVSAVANQFVIRNVDPSDKDRFMYSDNLWEVAKRCGFWQESDGLLDFLKVYAPVRKHSIYATRRIWRIFSIVAPSLNLNPDTNEYGDDYPFSVKADKSLTPQDLMHLNMDHYEGTPYDLTEGIAAGPYGDPHRFDMGAVDNMTIPQIMEGSYDRAISMFRTSYSFVAVSRADVPDILSLLWFSVYEPASSSYAPFYIASESVPTPYMHGSLFEYDEDVAFWNFLAAGNYASRFYKYAMRDVKQLQESLLADSIAAVNEVEDTVVTLYKNNPVPSLNPSVDELVNRLLTSLTQTQALRITNKWRALLPQLITKYHDGYEAADLTSNHITMKRLFYPKFWLDVTGFWSNKPNSGPEVIMYQPNSTSNEMSNSLFLVFVTMIVSIIGTLLAQRLCMGRKYMQDNYGSNSKYYQIELEKLYEVKAETPQPPKDNFRAQYSAISNQDEV